MSSGDDRWFLTPLSYLCVTTLRFFSPHNDFDLHSNYSVQLKAALSCIFYSRIRTGTRRRTRWAKRAPSRLTMSRKEKESSREGNSVLCRKFTKIHSRVLACSLDHISPKGDFHLLWSLSFYCAWTPWHLTVTRHRSSCVHRVVALTLLLFQRRRK